MTTLNTTESKSPITSNIGKWLDFLRAKNAYETADYNLKCEMMSHTPRVKLSQTQRKTLAVLVTNVDTAKLKYSRATQAMKTVDESTLQTQLLKGGFITLDIKCKTCTGCWLLTDFGRQSVA